MDQIGCKRSLLLYNNLINALCNANKVEKCHELLEEMKANGFAPSQFTHNSIFGYYCKFGNVEGALNMLREMRAHGHKPWIKHYTLLVKKLSTNRKVAEACSFMAMMSEIGFMLDMIAYAAAIDGWLNIGEKGLIPSVVTYNLLIDAYCKDNDIDQAVGFFSMMPEKKRNPNVITYSTLIDGLCNTGRSDEALLIWNQMVCSPNRIAYMVLVNGLCKCGKPDVALTYVKELEEKRMMGDTYNERLPVSLDKNCGILKEAVVKLLDVILTCSEVKTFIADGKVLIHLPQTGGS
ncbi:putative pentatricopeptide repeat-containing protein [Tanacetum coccineum]